MKIYANQIYETTDTIKPNLIQTMRVLLIIDMQKAFVNDQTALFDSDGVIERINLLGASFRQNGDKVIFIQHDGTSEGCCLPLTEEWEFLPSLDVKTTDLIISKTANDSFYKTTLKKELDALNVDELVIMGCSTDFCIDATVKSALTKDYFIVVIADGHTTEDKFNLTAPQVIDYYNWIWEAMPPTKFKIKVIDFDRYTGLSQTSILPSHCA